MNRIHTLDSLRGIFAILIVLLHFPAAWSLLYSPIVQNGGTPVNFFFVLSGFVVTRTYVDRIQSLPTLLNFILLRLGRIWPLHGFVLLLFLALEVAKFLAADAGIGSPETFFAAPEFWAVFLQDLFLVNAFRNVGLFELNFPAWSIGAEFWTYLAFGLIALAFGRSVLMAVLVMGLCLLVLLGVVDPGFGGAFGWSIFRALFYFLVGYLTFRIWEMHKDKALPAATALEVLMVLIIGAAIVWRQWVPTPVLVFGLIYAVTILIFSFQSGLVSRLLRAPFFQMIGTRSYSIYLLHIFVLSIIGSVLRIADRRFDLGLYVPGEIDGLTFNLLFVGNTFLTDIAVLLVVALVIWLSGLTYRFVEQPGQRLFKRLARRAGWG